MKEIMEARFSRTYLLCEGNRYEVKWREPSGHNTWAYVDADSIENAKKFIECKGFHVTDIWMVLKGL